MSHLHLLPIASMVERAPPGYSNRVRRPVEGADLETLDAEVEAAGGRIERRQLPESRSARGSRSSRGPHMVAWYVIPDSALPR